MLKGKQYIHAAVVLFGFSGLFGKWIDQAPAVIVFGRTLTAGIIFFLWYAASKRPWPRPAKKDLQLIMLQGVILAVHWGAFFHSIRLASVAVGLITFSTFPLFTIFLEPLFFKNSLRLKDIGAALIIVAGIFLVVPGFEITDGFTRGVFWGIFSGFSFALLTLLNKYSLAAVEPHPIVMIQNLTAAAVSAPFFIAGAGSLTCRDALLILLLGAVCTALAQLLYLKSLKMLRAAAVSFFMALEPVYGTVLAAVLLGEIPGLHTAAGGMLIVSAVFIITRGKRSGTFRENGQIR